MELTCMLPSAFFRAPLQRSMDQVGLHRLGRPCPDRQHVRSVRWSGSDEIDAHRLGPISQANRGVGLDFGNGRPALPAAL
jgi:hypothetical protein